ncbi:MAG: hypothetical protein CSA33_06190 [Desulfobulbus propionicus]|nr:MAG: hypothetical protein CSA33_06190 [Desulfobulbus propionicus]
MPVFVNHFFLLLAIFSTLHLLSPAIAHAARTYDVAYTWDRNLDNVLDYKTELEKLLSPAISKHLKVVKKGSEYGIIYDCNKSGVDIVKVIIRQGQLLREAGLDSAIAIQDKGYHELFNVSYGYGPNLGAMKKNYAKVYQYLGKSVGRHLYIEQDPKGNYFLVYRRHGDRSSTITVAKRHGRLLQKKGIQTSITAEHNNPVVFGESSYLHIGEQNASRNGLTEQAVQKIKQSLKVAEKNSTISKQEEKAFTQAPIILYPGNMKIAVHARAHGTNSYKGIIPAPRLSSTQEGLKRAAGSLMEKDVERYIKQLRRKGQLRGDEKTGWMVYDLNRNVSLVDINADRSFQAASMIKPFVALAFFHKVQQGQLKYGPKSRRQMEAMIQRSSNSATNWVMRQVGGPSSCQRLLLKQYRHLFKNLVIVEYIPAGGRTYRNKAMPSDYVRFLRALWNKELPYGKEIRRLMSLPGRDRLYYGTPIPQGTLVYNKTGTTAHLCGDMGILVPQTKSGSRYPYAIVGIIERSSRPSNYKQWMQSRGSVIRKISTLVYQNLKKKHALK